MDTYAQADTDAQEHANDEFHDNMMKFLLLLIVIGIVILLM